MVYTVYPKKYAHGFCYAVLCCGYTLTDFPISIRLTSLALWQSNDCPSASKATLMNMDKYFMWIHYERLHNHNKAKHNKTVCIFLGMYCTKRHVYDLSTLPFWIKIQIRILIGKFIIHGCLIQITKWAVFWTNVKHKMKMTITKSKHITWRATRTSPEFYKGRQFHHQRVYFVDDNQLKLAKSMKLEIAQPSNSAKNICQSCKALHFFIFRYQAITKNIHDFSQTER